MIGAPVDQDYVMIRTQLASQVSCGNHSATATA